MKITATSKPFAREELPLIHCVRAAMASSIWREDWVKFMKSSYDKLKAIFPQFKDLDYKYRNDILDNLSILIAILLEGNIAKLIQIMQTKDDSELEKIFQDSVIGKDIDDILAKFTGYSRLVYFLRIDKLVDRFQAANPKINPKFIDHAELHLLSVRAMAKDELKAAMDTFCMFYRAPQLEIFTKYIFKKQEYNYDYVRLSHDEEFMTSVCKWNPSEFIKCTQHISPSKIASYLISTKMSNVSWYKHLMEHP